VLDWTSFILIAYFIVMPSQPPGSNYSFISDFPIFSIASTLNWMIKVVLERLPEGVGVKDMKLALNNREEKRKQKRQAIIGGNWIQSKVNAQSFSQGYTKAKEKLFRNQLHINW
jgi:hypothetical protein